MKWIKTEDQLPEEGKYVLARHNRGTWRDSSDQENVNCVVVSLVRGISEAERESLDDSSEKKWTYGFGDEFGNNEVPYQWNTFGPGDFFGQEITHWMPIPPIKTE